MSSGLAAATPADAESRYHDGVRAACVGLGLVAIFGCVGAAHGQQTSRPPPHGGAIGAATATSAKTLALPPWHEKISPDDWLLLKSAASIEQRRFGDALRLLASFRPAKPIDIALQSVLFGQCYEGQSEVAKAHASYDAALAAVPNYPPAMLRKAVLDYRQGDPLRARKRLLLYHDADPGNVECAFYLSLVEPDPAQSSNYRRQVIAHTGPGQTWAQKLMTQPPLY